MAENNFGAAVELGLFLGIDNFLGQLSTAEQKLDAVINKASKRQRVELRVGLDWDKFESELRHATQLIRATQAQIKVGTSFYKGGSSFNVSKTALLRDVLKPLQNNIKDDRKYQIRIGTFLQPNADVEGTVANLQKKLSRAANQLEVKIKVGIDGDPSAQLSSVVNAAREAIGVGKEFSAAAAGIEGAAKRAAAAVQQVASAKPPAAAPAAKKQAQADLSGARQALIGLTETASKGGLDAAAIRELQKLASGAGIASDATGAKEIREQLKKGFSEAGDEAIRGLALGLAKGEIQIKGASEDVAKSLLAALKKSLRISSPSKETKELGRWAAMGLGMGFIDEAVAWERKMARAIRQAIGNAIKDGVGNAPIAGAMVQLERRMAKGIREAVINAFREGVKGSVGPGFQGAMLGATGGAATGGLVSGGAAGLGVAKGAIGGGLAKFAGAGALAKLGMLGSASGALAMGDTSALTGLVREVVAQFMAAAPSGALHAGAIGAAGVGGVAALSGFLRGGGGSLANSAGEALLAGGGALLGAGKQGVGSLVQQIQQSILAQAIGEIRASGGGGALVGRGASNLLSILQSGLRESAGALRSLADGTAIERVKVELIAMAVALENGAKDLRLMSGETRKMIRAFQERELAGGVSNVRTVPLSNQPGLPIARGGRASIPFDHRFPALPPDASWKDILPYQGKDGKTAYGGRIGTGWGVYGAYGKDSFSGPYGPPSGRNNWSMWDNQYYATTRTGVRPESPYRQVGSGGASRSTLGGSFSGTRDIGGGTFVPQWRRAARQPGGALALRNEPVEFFKSFKEANKFIDELQRRLADVVRSFDLLKVKSQLQVDANLRELYVTVDAVNKAFEKGEIKANDFDAALYGANRELAGLGSKSAEVQNLAQAFENLGIQSRAAYDSLQDQRNLDLQFIESRMGRGSSEATRARNARDIQQLDYANNLVRTAQSASGFGGFRGREIGNDRLNQSQQRSVLANAIREMQEYKDTIKLTETNAKTFERVQGALSQEIENASRAYRVLNDTAADGERITVLAHNAWGTILDDFENLVPQLLVFAVAYNLILQRVMATPGAVLQAAAAFDRLDTSISSYLSATRGIGDASGELSKVRDVALDLGVGYEKAAKSYLSFAAATQGTTLQGREAEISRTLFTAGRNQGLSGEQLDRAATALTQILSKGRVQAEELRGQLAEQLPGAVQVAARAYGVTTKELYRMVEAGQLASDEFVDKFMKQLVAEGADVNRLSGNFTNVTEQLGSSIQMLAASAGQPILAPLTEGLRLLNSLITALIPMGAPLGAFFLALASNAAKSALGLKHGWGQAISDMITMANGGTPGQRAKKPAPPGLPMGARGQLLMSGLGSMVEGARGFRTDDGGRKVADGWRQATTAITGFSGGLGRVKSDLRGVVASIGGIGTGLRAALLPALKFYLVFEGLNLLIKALNGDIGKLNNELKRATSNLEGKDKNPMGLNEVQKFLARLNPFKFVENEATSGRAVGISGISQKMVKEAQANSEKIRAVAGRANALDKEIYAERLRRDTASTEAARKESENRIKILEAEKKKAIESLGRINPEAMRSQVNLQRSAVQAQREIVTRANALRGTAQSDMYADAQAEKLKQMEEDLKALEAEVRKYGNVGVIKSTNALQGRLNVLQEALGNSDLNGEDYQRRLVEIAGLQKAINDEGLLPQERTMMVLEVQQKAITAEMNRQEQIAKVKLGILDMERKRIEANLDLERTRGKLQETLASRRVQMANAVNAPESALVAEAALRRIQAANEQRDLMGQRQLATNDASRTNVELELQKEQIRIQKVQIGIDLQMLAIEKAKIQAAMETKGISEGLKNTYRQLLGSIKLTEEATNSQVAAMSEVADMLSRQQEQNMQIYQTNLQRLGIQGQINQEETRTADILAAIKQIQLEIEASEKGQLELIRYYNDQLDIQASVRNEQLSYIRALVEAERVRLQLAEQTAGAQIELIDRTLQMQRGQFDGGYFERVVKMMAVGQSTEQDAMNLARQRMRLMQTIQEQQNKQRILELTSKKKELEMEKLMLRLKAEQLKLANQEARVGVRAAMERLAVAYDASGRTAEAQRVNARLNQSGGPNRYSGDTLQVEEQSLSQRLDMLDKQLKNIEATLGIGSDTIDVTTASIDDQIKAQKELAGIQEEILNQDMASWFANFLDQSTSLGRVLTEAAQGLTEFRQSVSAGLVEGLLGGNGTEAISDAGRQFAEKILTSLVDEYVMKPMEKNIFTGLTKYLGLEKTVPTDERIAKASEAQVDGTNQTNSKLDDIYTRLGEVIDSFKGYVESLKGMFDSLAKPNPQQARSIADVYQQSPVSTAAPALAGKPIRGAVTNRTRDPDAEATGWDIVVPGGVGGRVSNPFSRMKITGTGFQGSGSGSSGRGYGNWVSGEAEVAGKIYELFLGHFKQINVKPGDVLGPGGTIGLQGETGRTFGTHVTTHVNPKGGASVGDAWGVLEKVTRAWETGGIVANSGSAPVPVVVTNPAPQTPIASPAPAPAIAPGATGATPIEVVPFQEVSTASQQYADSLAKSTEANREMCLATEKAKYAVEETQGSFNKVGNVLGGITSILGSIGMGIAGVNQMKKGGTYNVLMGLAGIFGSISSIAGGFAPGGGFSSLFRASGGPVQARKPYIVGEQGPELFLPERSGNILSASRTTNAFTRSRSLLEKQREAMTAAGSSSVSIPTPGPIDVRYESSVINNVEYVTAEQHRKGMREAARMGQAMTLQGLQSSVRTRKMLAI